MVVDRRAGGTRLLAADPGNRRIVERNVDGTCLCEFGTDVLPSPSDLAIANHAASRASNLTLREWPPLERVHRKPVRVIIAVFGWP
jgi:hypothetical protein